MPVSRLFIATDISPTQREAAAQIISDLDTGTRFTKAFPKWVAPECLHVTMQFLGDTDDERIPTITQSIDVALVGASPFKFHIAGLGVFPGPREPRVIWLGVSAGAAKLGDLQVRIGKGLEPLGFEPERRAFHPHVTLARIKAQRGAEQIMAVLNAHKHADAGSGIADHLTLYRSVLSPEGPAYEVVHRWPLGAPQPTA